MCDILKLYLILGGIIAGIYFAFRFVFRKNKIKTLQIMSKGATVFLCMYPLKLILLGKNINVDVVIIPMSLIVIFFGRFYVSYYLFTKEKNIERRIYLMLGGLYCCLFLLGLPIYRYFDNGVQRKISVIVLVLNVLFLIVHYYRKWKK